jgi:acetyl-CoA carboxylase biotin carboxyl carrier protein
VATSSKKQSDKTKSARKKVLATKSKRIVAQPATSLTMQQVKEAIALLRDAGTFTTFSYRTPEFEIEIELQKKIESQPAVDAVLQPASTPGAAVPKVAEIRQAQSETHPTGFFEIKSPMVGTFYRRPNPTAKPYVEVGSMVEPDTPVCIVEVMKLLTTIPAGVRGHIAEICVPDAASIETGQVLMRIDPS